MASVRMSDRMREDLLHGLEEKFLTADPKPTMDSSLSQVILDAMIDHPIYKKASEFARDPLIQKALHNPPSTLRKYLQSFAAPKNVKRIDVKGFTFAGKAQEFQISLSVPANMFFVESYGDYMEVHLDDFNEPAKSKLVQDMTTKAQELLDWTKRHDDFMKAHRDLLKNCNTVGQFLEALPAAEALLDQEIQQKLNQKGKSTKDLAAEEARKNFDASAATPVLFAAEIIQAAGANDPNAKQGQ